MKLYFVRHGESEANVLRIISNRDLPHGLTMNGCEQAAAMALRLKNANISAIFTSPVLRAVQTTEIIARKLGLAYTVTDALREYDCGVLEGQADEESWRLHFEIEEDWIERQNWQRKPEQGESFLDIKDRFLLFIEQLTREKTHADSNILLVGHGGLFYTMLPVILSNINYEFIAEHGIKHTTCIMAEQQVDGLQCLQWGDVKLKTD